MKRRRAIIIGDSTNNTLSIVRSLGEANIDQILILKCEVDVCFVSKSKYLNESKIYRITEINECFSILEQLKTDDDIEQRIICSFDEAAVFIDKNENYLSKFYITPARGKNLGNLFDKDAQCRLATECGLIVPNSINFNREDSIDNISISFPVLLKPLNSTKGEKEDIHICKTKEDIIESLKEESHCSDFILQEFIDKEYEIDCIGVRTDKEFYLVGGIRKIRHYPPLIGAGAYGLFQPIECYDINVRGVEMFLEKSNYYGPFSVEFLHKDDKNYFMEVNFRNEGLAYAATAAGANLHALYVYPDMLIKRDKIKKIYMMNYSLDFLYVKDGSVPFFSWLRDLFRTRCFININFKDLNPIFCYYKSKICSRIIKKKRF